MSNEEQTVSSFGIRNSTFTESLFQISAESGPIAARRCEIERAGGGNHPISADCHDGTHVSIFS
jgi:hypothetical protein